MSRRKQNKPRRPRMRVDHVDGSSIITMPTGQEVEVRHKYGADPDDPGPGKHLWTVTAAWSVDPETFTGDGSDVHHFDHENMLLIAGPGCYKCEASYTPELAARPCRGSMGLLP
jgi:hypothetical protein